MDGGRIWRFPTAWARGKMACQTDRSQPAETRRPTLAVQQLARMGRRFRRQTQGIRPLLDPWREDSVDANGILQPLRSKGAQVRQPEITGTVTAKIRTHN